MDKLQPLDPNTVQASEMPNERTLLELAKEIVDGHCAPHVSNPDPQKQLQSMHRGEVARACIVAAALIERSTPVEMKVSDGFEDETCTEFHKCPACKSKVPIMGRPNFTPCCGKGITWK